MAESDNKRYSIPVLFFVALIFILIPPSTLAAEASDSPALGTVRLELKWKHAFQFAGYYAAIEKGFYRDAGIKVTLHEHFALKSPTDVLLAGDAEYATAGAEVVIQRANGQPVVALAAIFQHSPMAFLVTNDSGIEHAEDLSEKRLMIQRTYQDIALVSTLRKVGITEKDYLHIPTTFDALALTRGEADAFGGYTTDQGFRLAEIGIPNHFILPRHYGIDFYADVLVTTEKEIKTHPERVRGFLKASLQGWEYALRHQAEIIDLILRKYNTQGKSRTHLEYEARASRDLIRPILVGIGHMNLARWEHIKEVFVELGILEDKSDISGLMYRDKHANTGRWLDENWPVLVIILVLLIFISLAAFAFQLRRLVVIRIRDLADSESELRALIDVQPGIIITASETGQVQSINQTGLALINAPSAEAVYSTPLENFIDDEHLDNYREAMKKVFCGEAVNLVLKSRKMDGSTIWLDVHAVPFSNSRSQISRILVVSYDISDKIKIEGDKTRLQTELQVARKMEALGLLTGGIAHDFNNLLAIILGYSNIALVDSEGDERIEFLEYFKRINHAGERAKSLVDQMLVFSRGDREESTSIDLGVLIESDLRILTAALPSSIIIDTKIAASLPSVRLTPSQFNQILMNFAINARDAMEGKGKLSITLAVSNVEDTTCSACQKNIAGNWVELSITDTGTGINAKILERMFEPFFTTKAVGKGSGMGLAVIYGIVHNNQGHIIVESKEGEGSTFRILFPVDGSKDDSIHETGKQQMLPQGRGAEIMVVDDEVAYGKFMKILLDKNGYRTLAVSDPMQALQLFETEPDRFDLIITDQTMSVMKGVELIKNVRSIRPKIPLILCSGYSEHFTKEDAATINVSYLSKPVKPEVLLVEVEKLITHTAE